MKKAIIGMIALISMAQASAAAIAGGHAAVSLSKELVRALKKEQIVNNFINKVKQIDNLQDRDEALNSFIAEIKEYDLKNPKL